MHGSRAMSNYPPNQQPPNQQPPQNQRQPPYQPPPYQQGPNNAPYNAPYTAPYTDPNALPPALSMVDQLMNFIRNNVAIVAAAGVFVLVCILGMCLVVVALFRSNNIPAPATQIPPTQIVIGQPTGGFVVTPIPQAPAFDPKLVDTALNAYVDAQLSNMSQLAIQVVNPQTQVLESKGVVFNGSGLEGFVEALNVGVLVDAPDLTCQPQVQLLITRTDNSTATISLCLTRAGIRMRSADLPGLRGGDLIFPASKIYDVLQPFLPAEYLAILGLG